MTTITPKIEIDTFTSTYGETAGQTLYSLWFWVDGKCTHIRTFDSHHEAKWTGEKVLEAVEHTRQAIRKAI